MIINLNEELKKLLAENIENILGYGIELPDQIDDKCKLENNVEIRITPVGCGKNRPIIFSFVVGKRLNKKFTAEFKAQFDLNDKWSKNHFYGWSVTVKEDTEWGSDYEIASFRLRLEGNISKEIVDKTIQLCEELIDAINYITPLKTEKE